MYKNSFYKKFLNPINENILNQVNDVIKNKNNNDIKYWKEKEQYCCQHGASKDIDILKQCIIESQNCPPEVVQGLVMTTANHNVLISALINGNKLTPHEICYLLATIPTNKIKELFKNAKKNNNQAPLPENIIEYMTQNYPPHIFDGWHLMYTKNQDKIEEMLNKQQLSDRCLLSIIKNNNIALNIKIFAFENSDNIYSIINNFHHIPQEILYMIYETAISTIYEVESNHISKETRKTATDMIKLLIDEQVLSPKQQMDIYDLCMNDSFNTMTSISFMRHMLPKTNNKTILELSKDISIYNNPNVSQEKLDKHIIKLLNDLIENKTKFGTTIWRKTISKIMLLYSLKENNSTTNQQTNKQCQENLISYMKKFNNKLSNEVWDVYREMATNPTTENEQLKHIINLNSEIKYLHQISFAAKMNLALKKSKLTDKVVKTAVKSFINNSRLENINIENNQSLQVAIKDFIETLSINQTTSTNIKNLKKMVDQLKKQESFKRIYDHDFFKHPAQINTNTNDNMAMDLYEFQKLSRDEQLNYYNSLTNAELKRLENTLIEQSINYTTRFLLYKNISSIEGVLSDISDITKERKKTKINETMELDAHDIEI